MLGTKIGAMTVFSGLLDTENRVRIVFDRQVLSDKLYGCSDGTTTGYMKLRTEDICEKLLPYADHTPLIIEVQHGALSKSSCREGGDVHPHKRNGKERPALL